jgi:hypothetical protein
MSDYLACRLERFIAQHSQVSNWQLVNENKIVYSLKVAEKAKDVILNTCLM